MSGGLPPGTTDADIEREAERLDHATSCACSYCSVEHRATQADVDLAARLVIALRISAAGGEHGRQAYDRARGYVEELALALGVEGPW